MASNVESIMSALDNLTSALNTLATSFAAHDVAVQNEIAALKAALAAGNDAAVQAAADNVSALSTKLAAETADLVASIPPTPVPTP